MSKSDIHPKLQVYHKTLHPANGSHKAVIGSFIFNSKGQQQVARAVGSRIELWTFSKESASFKRVVSQETFSHLQSIEVLKSLEGPQDHLVVLSDSGNITLARFDVDQMRFIPIANEPFDKSGVRRMGPNEYLAVDGRNSAVFLGAIEQHKLIFKLERDESSIALSSPLESNRPNTVTFAMIGLDNGYENPLFAALEVDYSMPELKKDKLLNFYEMDFGLNHILRVGSQKVAYEASHLIAVPGGEFGPSGVLVCSKGKIEYRSKNEKDSVSINLPQRKNGPVGEIVCSVVHQMKKSFFILAQSQLGDMYRITLDFRATQEMDSYSMMSSDKKEVSIVNKITIRYFDTIPLCANLLIFKSGFIYANSEMGDQYIYQFEKLGDGPGEREWTSNDPEDNLGFEVKPFDNLSLVNVVNALNPLLGVEIDANSLDITKVPQIITVSGTKSRSTLKLLSNELKLEPIVNQDLPSQPRNIWTCKIDPKSKLDDFIVITFDTSTIALKIGDEVEEAESEDTGLDGGIFSIEVVNVGDSIVQVHQMGFKQIFFDGSKVSKTIKWDVPSGLTVLKSASTCKQLVLSLSNGELVYFEANSDGSQSLNEFTKRKSYMFQVTSLSFGEIPKGNLLSPFIIVGTKDQTLQVLSTSPQKAFDVVSSIDTVNVVSDIKVTNDFANSINGEGEMVFHDSSITHLHVGYQNGVYTRYEMSSIGELLNPQNKFIGPEKIQLKKFNIDGLNYVSIHNIRTWVSYPNENLVLRPLPKPEKLIEDEDEDEEEPNAEQVFSSGFTSICNLNSEDIESGVLLIHDNKLVISSKPEMNKADNVESIPLRYTPRDTCFKDQKGSGVVYVACSDQVKSFFKKDVIDDEYTFPLGGVIGDEAHEEDEDSLERQFEKSQQYGYELSKEWSSCVHTVSLQNNDILQTIELLNNESAHRIELLQLAPDGDDQQQDYVFVSTIENFQITPRKYTKCYIRVYKVLPNGSLEHVYKHQMPQPVLAMKCFQGKALLGWHKELGLFELGRKQLIRKSGYKFEYNVKEIVGLETEGSRVFVNDISDSVKVLVYVSQGNKFIEFADDSLPRHVTRSVMLDYDTLVIGDKFGTISILRVPTDISEISDLDVEGELLEAKPPKLNGAPERLENLMNFYVGDVITGMKSCKLGLSTEQVVIYSGMNGSIGMISPLKSLREVNFFSDLQKMVLAQLNDIKWNLTEREHLKYRGYYIPTNACIDGDIVDLFTELPLAAQQKISNEMEKPIDAISNRIADFIGRVGI